MTWDEILTALGGTKRIKRQSHYVKKIRSLAEAGFRLATPAIATAYASAGMRDYNEELGCVPAAEYLGCNDTYIKRKPPNEFGFYSYSTHDRSEHVDEAIDALAALHSADIDAERAWLLPVYDNDEYTSWDFDVAVGTEEEVVALLIAAKPKIAALIATELAK